MRRRLLPVLAFTLMVVGGATWSSAASAEDGPPAMLLLSEEVTKFEFAGSAGAKGGKGVVIETLGKKQFLYTMAKLEGKTCNSLEGKATDANLCEGLLTLTGVKREGVSCRSETAAGVKDPVETVLTKLDLHLAAEIIALEELLLPLLALKLMGVDGGEELIVNCAAVKSKIKGRVPCLLSPGLAQIIVGGEFLVECEQSEGDQLTGTCITTKQLCVELAKDPLLVSPAGGAFEDAGLEFNPAVKQTANRDFFIDD